MTKFPFSSSTVTVMMVLTSLSIFYCGFRLGQLDGIAAATATTTVISNSCSKTTNNNNSASDDENNKEKNIVFIKVPKVGGSTFGGVLRRAATKLGLSGTKSGGDGVSSFIPTEPGIWAEHTPFDELKEKFDALKQPKFLVSMIRTPHNRALSSFYYFEVSDKTKSVADTDQNILDYLKQEVQTNYMLNYLRRGNNVTVSSTLTNYNFIGVTERFDESILVLKHLLNVTLEDIVYVASKDSHQRSNFHTSSHLYDSQSLAVKSYIDSEFAISHQLDYNLYEKASKILDEHIRSIPNFDIELATLQSMLQTASNTCRNLRDCYWRDNGCGIQCLNTIKIDDY